MSQIAGRRLPQLGVVNQNFDFATVAPVDSNRNGGLATIAYGPNSTSYIDDADAAALGVYYYGDKAPDADKAKAVFRICRGTVVSPGVTKYEWAGLPDMSSCGNYDHLWSSRRNLALLTYN